MKIVATPCVSRNIFIYLLRNIFIYLFWGCISRNHSLQSLNIFGLLGTRDQIRFRYETETQFFGSNSDTGTRDGHDSILIPIPGTLESSIPDRFRYYRRPLPGLYYKIMASCFTIKTWVYYNGLMNACPPVAPCWYLLVQCNYS